MYPMHRRPHRRKYPAWAYISDSELPTSPRPDLSDLDLRRRRPHTALLPRLFGSPAGSLKILTEIPLEVLLEIFSHLHPLDLIHLARTTKRLRSLLISPSARSVWRSALMNVQGLPCCPPDMTEPQFAKLAFDNHCHFCFASNMQQVFWSCRIRCCQKCIPKYFVAECVLEDMMLINTDLQPELYYHSYISTFPYIVYPKPRRNRPGRILYYLPVAEKYIHELSTLSRAEVECWRSRKKLEQAQRLTHAALCESWSIHWVYHQSPEYNAQIIISLLLILLYLWRDALW